MGMDIDSEQKYFLDLFVPHLLLSKQTFISFVINKNMSWTLKVVVLYFFQEIGILLFYMIMYQTNYDVFIILKYVV